MIREKRQANTSRLRFYVNERYTNHPCGITSYSLPNIKIGTKVGENNNKKERETRTFKKFRPTVNFGSEESIGSASLGNISCGGEEGSKRKGEGTGQLI